MERTDISTREKISACWAIAEYHPGLALLVIAFSCIAALLEGIGMTFLIPIIELARAGDTTVDTSDRAFEAFLQAYQFLGIPFTLEWIILGVSLIMTVRYVAGFFLMWLGEMLRTSYVRDLQIRGIGAVLYADVAYIDREGSDEILNAIITQTSYAGDAIRSLVLFFEVLILVTIYVAVALYLAPGLTLITATVLLLLAILTRITLEPGYTVGDRLADANERLQTAAQAATQGPRDVRLFGLREEIAVRFERAAQRFYESTITMRRNQAVLSNLYQLSAALTVFGLVYVALRFLSLPFSVLAVFLFAMFRIAPQVSYLNSIVYQLAGDLPHVVRTRRFIHSLEEHDEPDGGTKPVPDVVDTYEFDEVTFSYGDEEPILSDMSFSIDRGEFVAIVGPSGAGKSTIISLLARLNEPRSGRILADGVTIREFDLDEWRSHLAIVRQKPYIFDETLRYNLTVGNRDATRDELDRVCEIARVTEFMDLPEDYTTTLGEDGVKLSGGQRQRIAIARALLEDAEVLVLDEATSELDPTLERSIYRRLDSMDEEYTVVAVAHRLSTVEDADRILTVEAGQIVEQGKHNELLASDGRYATLYEDQF